MWWSQASDDEGEYLSYSAATAPNNKPLKCDACMTMYRKDAAKKTKGK